MADVFISHLEWTGAATGPTRDPATFSRDLDVSMDATSVVHFIMQRKQLLGIRRRAESTPAETLVPWEEPCLRSHHTR